MEDTEKILEAIKNLELTIISIYDDIKDNILKNSRMENINNIYLEEYLHKRDMNSDGVIYGFDFALLDPPPLLKTINNEILKLNSGIKRI